jgi:2-polyprenyl-3-methyl-5-hydroxy-6-metoxy-1,4-benzoquinol methylase
MWNHNIHFHNYLLRQLPTKINRALDVGCGLGMFASKLSERAKIVDAIDVDNAILKEALNRHNAPNIYYKCTDFLKTDLPNDSYDAIVSIASLHHMDLEIALNRMKLLLRPSGKLLILGLYKETTILDYTYSAISVPLNLVYLNCYSTTNLTSTLEAPTTSAQLSLKQIKSIANSLLPNCKIQRHLFWRYSLIWQKN